MSLPRSIDRTDLAGATVTLTANTETLTLVGPALQTPKDTSFIMTLVAATLTTGTGVSTITGRVRQGNAGTGAVIGQPYVATASASGFQMAFMFMVTQQVQATDYVQNCVTFQQASGSTNGTVSAATILMISF